MSKDFFFIILLVSLACESFGQLNSQGKQFILDLHNEARRRVGAPNMREMVGRNANREHAMN